MTWGFSLWLYIFGCVLAHMGLVWKVGGTDSRLGKCVAVFAWPIFVPVVLAFGLMVAALQKITR